MLFSTKSKYALQIVVDLAENYGDKYIPLKDIAKRQSISVKYLEKIVPLLSRAGLIKASHGKGGGYMLTKAPEEYTVADILWAVEMNSSDCQSFEIKELKGNCKLKSMWADYYRLCKSYFSAINIKQITE